MALEDPVDPAMKAALAARYGQGAPEAIRWNDTIAALMAHRSVRHYLPDPLPAGTVETLVAVAQSAATSSNLQMASVIAVTDPAVKETLAEFAGGQRHLVKAPLVLLWVADHARARAIAAETGEPVEGLDYLETFLVAALDAALAAQNAAIAAQSLGLGICYIGALRNRPLELAELAGLPSGTAVVFGMTIGLPDPARPAEVKPRLPQQAVLHHGTYGEAAPAAIIAAYDDTARAFQQAVGMRTEGWSRVLLARVRSAASLIGRDRLREYFVKLGFPMR